jgi:hypothetical protein
MNFRNSDARGAADETKRRPGGLPWGLRDDDLGLRVVDEVGHSLTLDREWSVQRERGFTWWGKDLAQHVWAEPGVADDAFEIFRLHAQTELLRDFEPNDRNLGVLNAFAGLATTSGYLVDHDARTVRMAASMYVHAETEDWVRLTFQLVTAMQAADAQIKAEPLAEATGSIAATSAHPSSGPREEYDGMLHVLEHFVGPLGMEPSAWEGEELEWTTAMIQRGTQTVLATGDATGLGAEFPFQSRTSLLTVSSAAVNPQLGNGVLLVLHLPMAVGEADGLRFAAELTGRELSSLTRSHFIGAWCWRDDGMHHVTFLPNAVHFGRGDVLNAAMSMGLRARWIAETFYGDNWDANLDEGGRPLATPSFTDLIGTLIARGDDEWE